MGTPVPGQTSSAFPCALAPAALVQPTRQDVDAKTGCTESAWSCGIRHIVQQQGDFTQGLNATQESSFELDDCTAARVEFALRRTCTALTSEPPVTQEAVEELRRLDPGPSAGERDAVNELRVVGQGTVLVVDPDTVRKALANFAPTSGSEAL